MRAALLLLTVLATPAVAVEAGAAAGVLTRDGVPFCSGVLIAPDRVLTAAHCGAVGKDHLGFRTGAYPGHGSVTRSIRAVMTHPMYIVLPVARSADIAILALDTPIEERDARPIPWGRPAENGERLVLASYPGGAGDRARERPCLVSESDATRATLACRVIPGESGGPVLRRTEAGPEVAALVVAYATTSPAPRAIAVQIETRARQLAAAWGFETP